MRSLMPGKNTSAAEVTNVSAHGIWLLVNDKESRQEELLLSYEDFPWFREAPINVITNVEEPLKGHYYWPALDVDLSREIIKHPERFPLRAQIG
uniref:Integron cassette protein n=1 Tax=Candidatus Kentrum sp. DK TaxID=2126562 RepID=A0A450TKZ9_9GAMM|nr:MAG: Protein of unknown function (DUF2442) [Candidatus Kentron sp. DK]VFJ70093.1 MAG: Protein of unknown function (DUF2442) [Candidatus Kentron sp. DK]